MKKGEVRLRCIASHGYQISSNAKPHCSQDHWEHPRECARLSCLDARSRILARRRYYPPGGDCHRQNCRVQTASRRPVPNMACHFFGPCTFLRILPASCLMTCFVNTPEERNLTPSFISSSSTFCPSSLMQVTFLSSITSSRPRSSAAAFRHSFLSSAAHGATSLPSSNNRRRSGVSKMVIFNICFCSHRRFGQSPLQTLGAVSR